MAPNHDYSQSIHADPGNKKKATPCSKQRIPGNASAKRLLLNLYIHIHVCDCMCTLISPLYTAYVI